MEPYALAAIYRDLREALATGREAAAARHLGAALGLDLPPPSATALAGARDRLDAGLTYRGFKPAELATMADDLKPVVKFEDIPLPAARQFVARFGADRQVLATPPYVKDYLLLRTQRAAIRAGQSAAGQRAAGEPMTSLYVSRTDAASRLQRIEAETPDDVRACGALLGFPPCCVAAFAADFERSRRDQDAVNDDACRRLLASGDPVGGTGPGEPALNPTSDLELLGFYPCSLHCPAALAMANRAAGALARLRPAVADRASSVLPKPVLFWRLPFFFRLDGEPDGDSLRYRAVRANAFAEPAARAAQTLFAACLLPLLDAGDRLRAHGAGLDIYRGDRRVATLDVDPELAPLAVGWRQWSPIHGPAPSP